MAKLRTKNGGEYRSFVGRMKLLEAKSEFLFPVELWLLNEAVNRNKWRYERIENHLKDFLGTPILVAYVNGGKTVGDGHNFRDEIDPLTGESAPSFTDATAERIVGAISEREEDVRLVSDGGKTWVVARGTLWAWYAKELVEKIERDAKQGRVMSVSIETLVTRSRTEGEVEVEEEYDILGTTILGDHVQPAVEGARITALSVREQEFKTLKLRAAAYENQLKSTERNDTMEVFTKKQCEKLQEKFGSDYRVLGAVKDEKGIHIALCGADYALYRCELGDMKDQIVRENLVLCAAKADMGIGTPVDLSALFDEPGREIQKLNEALAAEKSAREVSEKKVADMVEAEKKRRVETAKAIAKATLEAFNENRAEKVDETVLNDIYAAIEKGNYTDRLDEKGEWCGDKAVENDVFAKCGREVQKSDRMNAQKNKSIYAYEMLPKGNEQQSGIEKLLAEKGII